MRPAEPPHGLRGTPQALAYPTKEREAAPKRRARGQPLGIS